MGVELAKGALFYVGGRVFGWLSASIGIGSEGADVIEAVDRLNREIASLHTQISAEFQQAEFHAHQQGVGGCLSASDRDSWPYQRSRRQLASATRV